MGQNIFIKERPKSIKGHLMRFFKTFGHIISGLKHLFLEPAFQMEALGGAATMLLLWFLKLPFYDNLWIIFAVMLILIAEALNTAIESVVDRVSLEMHPLSGRAKDTGSVAVALSCVFYILVWVFVLYKNFF